MRTYPSCTVAAVQAAPEYLDAPATTAKACALIAEAAAHGAEVVAFPEVFIPGYPYWNWTLSPLKGSAWFEHYFRSSIDVPGPEVASLCDAARHSKAMVVIGVSERDPNSMGTLYNSLLFISAQGQLLGVHRKLVPTWAEKLTWAGGDGATLRVYDTPYGRVGGLACGENTNTLARFTLLAQGEQIHVANYISLPTAPEDYDMVEAIKLRAAAHSFEGKVFSLVACSTISPEMVEQLSDSDESRALLTRKHSAFSGVFGPDGQLIGDGLVDDDGIVYAEIDLNRSIQPKQMHDIVGHYNRFDVFELRVNRRLQRAVTFSDESSFVQPTPSTTQANSPIEPKEEVIDAPRHV